MRPDNITRRNKRILARIANGENSVQVAARFKLSDARIRQIVDASKNGHVRVAAKEKSTTPSKFVPRKSRSKRRKTNTKPIANGANVNHEETVTFTHTKEDVAVALATGHCREIIRQLAGQTGVPERLLAERVGRTLPDRQGR